MRRKSDKARPSAEHEEMDITALSTPPQKPQGELLMSSPPLDLANSNRFNLSRESSSMDVSQSIDSTREPVSPATVQAVPWSSREIQESSNTMGNGRPNHRARMSYDEPRTFRRYRGGPDHRRRFSYSARFSNNHLLAGDDDLEGDLGYAANEDLEGNQKCVIVERLEMVKSKNPVFTWC